MTEILVCPLSKQPLRLCEQTNSLISDSIGVSYPIVDGIPCLVPPEAKILDGHENPNSGDAKDSRGGNSSAGNDSLSLKSLASAATTSDFKFLRRITTQTETSAAILKFGLNGKPTARIFASYSIYKGKAALSADPLLPMFTKMESGDYIVDRRGSIMLTFWPAIGERKYDWEKRKGPRQPFNTKDCGYYVCRFMLEIIQNRAFWVSNQARYLLKLGNDLKDASTRPILK